MAITINENQRRDQVTIMTDLLENMLEARRLTHILYRSNMSYTQLVKYLNSMIDLGFIEEQTKPFRCFKIKENGKIFMDLMKKNRVSNQNVNGNHNGVDKHIGNGNHIGEETAKIGK